MPFDGTIHTCVIACSKEAKARGVKNVMKLAEAKKLCPELILQCQSPDLILTMEAAKDHFSALLNGRRNEAFTVIYLNAKNRLIDEDLWEGSIDRATFYPREIMRRIIILDASGILIAHNHPTGDTTPSQADIRETIDLETTLMTIDTIFLDHLIFGEGEPYSLRENGDI